MYTVTLLQEYVPKYREPLFRTMKQYGRANDILIRVAAGRPNSSLLARADGDGAEVDVELRQRELTVLGRRLVLRSVESLYAASDLIVVEQARRNLDLYVQLLRRPQKIAMWGHGRNFTTDETKMADSLLRLATNRCSWFFGYTEESVEAVVTNGFDPRRTTTLRNSTDTRSLRKHLDAISGDDIARFRSSLGAKRLAVTVGAVDRPKRLDFLIEAADRVAENVDGFKLVIAGDGSESSFVQEAASSRDWLIKLPPVYGPDLAILLKSADVLAMPGRIGLVAVDALTAGLPTVTTDWPYHAPERAYLDAANCVVSDDTTASYAEALVRALSDDGRLADLRAGCASAASGLSIEDMARRFVDGICAALTENTQ